MNQIQCILRKCIYSLPCIYFSIFILSTWICLGIYTENKVEWQWIVILIHTILLPVDLIFLYKIKEIAQARLPDLNWPCICCFILIQTPKIRKTHPPGCHKLHQRFYNLVKFFIYRGST